MDAQATSEVDVIACGVPATDFRQAARKLGVKLVTRMICNCRLAGFKAMILILALSVGIPSSPAAPAEPPVAELRLLGERLSIRADNVPLSVIVRQFQDWGVTVDFMPETDPRLSVWMENVDVEAALASILGRHDYVLRWRTIPGPLGAWQQLRSIRILGGASRRTPLATAAVPADPVVIEVPGTPGAFMIRDEMLVRFRSGTSVADAQRLLDQLGGGLVDGSPLVGVYRIRLRPHTNVPDLIDQLAGHGLIEHAEPHWAWRRPGESGMPDWQDSDGIAMRATSTAVAGRVVVLDTGIDDTAPWRSALVNVTGTIAPDDAGLDIDGHGTRMSGLAGGFMQPMGVAWSPDAATPAADVLSIRIFDDDGIAPLSGILRGIEQAIENRGSVMSLSWGGPQNSRFLEEALTMARYRGVIPLAAAGNEPTGEPVYPAALPAVLAVGALHPNGQAWEQSNYGSFVSLVAPGFAKTPNQDQSAVIRLAGTSVSTAYAAGVLARYRARHPGKPIEDVLADFLRALSPPHPAADGSQALSPGRLDDAALNRLFNR